MIEIFCVNTGLMNSSKAGDFETKQTKFSSYMPYIIYNAINSIRSDIFINYYIENKKSPEEGDIELLFEDLYILGPVYKNNETQIGFTGKNKMKIENNTMFIESSERTIIRELFEESGLLLNNNMNIINGNVYNLSDFSPVKDNINNNTSLTFIHQKDWFDILGHNKKYKFHSGSVIISSKKSFIDCYSNSKEFFNSIRDLLHGDNISHIACIKMIDVHNYMNIK